jgi:hypothetical protein
MGGEAHMMRILPLGLILVIGLCGHPARADVLTSIGCAILPSQCQMPVPAPTRRLSSKPVAPKHVATKPVKAKAVQAMPVKAPPLHAASVPTPKPRPKPKPVKSRRSSRAAQHPHLDKNARTLDVQVNVPARLMAHKPPANHKGRAKKHR